jgi:hypothetical protein
MLERDGWSLENAGEVTKKGAGAADLKDAKETREAAWHHALMTAEIPDPETADMLRRRKTDDRDRARLEAFNIVTTLAVHKVTQQAIDTWDEGRMAAKVARFEDLLNIGDLPPVESQKLIERDGRLARRKMLRGLFDNIDLTSDCPFTPETQRVFIDRLMAQHDAFVAVGLLPAKWRSKRTKAGKLTPPARPKSFGPVLKDIAERLGLQVIERRERVAQKHAPLYKVIQSDTFSGHPEKVRVFGIDPESWQMMMSIIERRKEPPKPWETPTCLEDLTLEELGIGRHDISDLIGPSVLAGFGSAVASFRIGEALERFPIGAVLRAEHKRRRSLW